MSKAGIYSLAVFLAFALGGLALFFLVQPWLLGVAAFVAAGMIGSIVASRVFNRLATPEEKRQDLEDRVRNSDL
jgi:Na+/glutamate symporter